MGRNEKTIEQDAPARELAVFMRSLRLESGLTWRAIAAEAHMAHTTLTQNSDGRFRGWASVQQWFHALYTAAAAHGQPLSMSHDVAVHHARHLWDIACARQRQGPHRRAASKADSSGGNDRGPLPTGTSTGPGYGDQSPAQRGPANQANLHVPAPRRALTARVDSAAPVYESGSGGLYQPRAAGWAQSGCPTCGPRRAPIGPGDPELRRILQGQEPATAALVAIILLRSSIEDRLAWTRLLIHLLDERE